jgi:hypothetical protein
MPEQPTSRPASTSQSSRRRVRQCVLAGAFLTLISASLPGTLLGTASAASAAPMAPVKYIELPHFAFPTADGLATIVDSSARRLFVVEQQYTRPDTTVVSRLHGYDLDTMQATKIVEMPAIVANIYAVDSARHHLFISSASGATIYQYSTTDPAATPRSLSGPANFGGVGGFYYSRQDSLLYVVYFHPRQQAMVIAALDPDSGDTGSVLWTASLPPQCGGGISYNYPWVLGESYKGGPHLYTVCSLQGHALPGSPPPAAAVRVALPSDPRKAATSYPADLYPGITPGETGGSESLWVPEADRIVTTVPVLRGAGWAAYVFDAASTSFVGAPTLFQPTGGNTAFAYQMSMAVDSASGRVFAQDFEYSFDKSKVTRCYTPVDGMNLFAIAEGAALGNAAVQIPTGDQHLYGADHGMAFDPVQRNLWMVDLETKPTSCSSTSATPTGRLLLAVFHDNRPPAKPIQLGNLDSGTANLSEQPGATGANLTAQASAFGARYRLAPSGVEGPLTNVSVSGTTSLSCTPETAYGPAFGSAPGQPTPPDAPPLPVQYHAFCHAGNREATFAHVPAVALDNSEVRGDAVAADTDRESAQNLAQATDATQPGGYANDVVGYVNGQTGAKLPAPCPQTSAPSGGISDSCSPFSASGPTGATGVSAAGLAPYASGEALPFTPATCRDSGGDAKEDVQYTTPHLGQVPLTHTGPSEARVQCALEASLAQGSAYSNSPNVNEAPVFAHDTYAAAQVSKTDQGTVATSDSIVTGITVGAFLHIARLEMHAKAQAHGRPGTSNVDYSCTVTGVSITLPQPIQQTVPGGVPGSVTVPTAAPSAVPVSSLPMQMPETTNCYDPRLTDYLAQLNRQLQGYARVEFPAAPTLSELQSSKAPEPELTFAQVASPGGYVAQIGAPLSVQLQNTVLFSDPSVEQPGLVVTLYGDSASERDRFVSTFGGVAASAKYGIYALPATIIDQAPPPDAGAVVVVPGASSQTTIDRTTTKVVQRPSGNGSSILSGGIAQIVATIVDGFRVLWQHPDLIPPVLAVWALLAWPCFVLLRRRALLGIRGEVL